ncbi:conserved hypothetical protein [Methylorubrum populi BJ001]|jgi:hypothetical protein|uniref:PhoD-like phosphatase domain-containing protein n=1 Tax=Methylorubrum populi (strain ATCC BAA-705 / NCIMB 13946 / BJ001) TaxID=441620 RepID=B1ZGS9_METPB|nr:alkaline phosphatase D family protein [Methylorubrum populi]ACB82607.1 conserved hypothetical protein [Methylorubrum populi BJ001]
MSILMGPVLSFRGCEDGNWNLSALVVFDRDPEKLLIGRKKLDSDILWEAAEGSAHRFEFSAKMKEAESKIEYKIGGRSYEIAVPSISQAPTMAYASCNGFSSLKLMKGVKDKNVIWKVMARRHGLNDVVHEQGMPETEPARPYHLLLQGGDQVYADAMWETVPSMHEWNEKDWHSGNAAPLTPEMQRALNAFFFGLYVSRWSQPDVARMLARVPSIAMWDDHDLIDGWGSYPPERQNCAVFGGIWAAAAKAFSVFQQHLKAGERRPGTIGQAEAAWWQKPATQEERSGAFSIGYVVGPTVILAVDMRSQRTEKSRVVSEGHWSEAFDWLDTKQDITHALLLSSIPVVYPGFDTIEKLLGIFPGHQDLEDDLRDHWRSHPHKGERLRLIYKLLALSKRGVRATIVSGDVHVAALGAIESRREQAAGSENVINQLISSAIVHPGPGAVVLFALQHLFDSEEEIDRGLFGRMMTFPNSKSKFLGGRNYLSIEPDAVNRLWCNWFVEGQDYPFTKVIHPLGQAVGEVRDEGNS